MYFETEDEIRRRVSRRYQRWTWFVAHLVLTLPVGLILDSFRIFGRGFSDFLLAIWFAALILHGLVVFLNNAKEQAIQSEIERQQYLAAGSSVKAKRSNRLSLGADGELLEQA